MGDACVPRLRRVAPAQPGTTRMFPQRHVPHSHSRRIGAALGDAGCNSAASTAIKPLCLRDLPRTLRTNYAAEAADVF